MTNGQKVSIICLLLWWIIIAASYLFIPPFWQNSSQNLVQQFPYFMNLFLIGTVPFALIYLVLGSLPQLKQEQHGLALSMQLWAFTVAVLSLAWLLVNKGRLEGSLTILYLYFIVPLVLVVHLLLIGALGILHKLRS